MTFEIITPATHEQWLEERTRFVTSTEVASAHETKTMANWQRIKEDKLQGSSFTGNKWTEWGHESEPELAEYAQVFLDNTLVLNTDPQQIVTRDGCSASPDAFNPDFSTGAEFKTTKVPLPDNPAFSRYLCQVQMCLWITGAKHWWLVWWQHENFVPVDIQSQKIMPDPELQAKLVETAAELSAYIFEDVTPSWFTDSAAFEELEPLVKRLGEVEQEKTRAEQEAKQLKARICELTGESASAELGGWKLTVWTRKPSKRFDSTKFKKEHEELYSQYMKTSGTPSKSVRIQKIEEVA